MSFSYQPIFAHPTSRHARVRMQQRSIPQVVIDLLLDFAEPVPAGGGCELFRFNAESWTEAFRASGARAGRMDRYRNAYAVVGADGLVVTAARLH